jgi:hypothetical protein
LFGPGGIGKTRLALQAARQAADTLTDSVCLVSLETVETADHLPTAIATALKIPLCGRREPRMQLLAYLLERELLLVLDNFEHLLPETALLTEILKNAAGVKLLVTSLASLNLYEEWVLAIEGLPHLAKADVDNLSGFDAVTLFQQRARQVQAAFDLAGNEVGVLAICRLLQGMPLGIELAAAWVRTRSPAQIARQIEADLSTLATSLRNVPARHRSMVAVFDHAWRLLQAGERQLMRRLPFFVAALRPRPAVKGLALAEQQQLVAERALTLDGLGLLALMRGDLAQAAGYLNDSLTLSRQALTSLFITCYHQGELARAAAYARESLAVNRNVGGRRSTLPGDTNTAGHCLPAARPRPAVNVG